jgi:predicted GNAT superfamily acetyltransferase
MIRERPRSNPGTVSADGSSRSATDDVIIRRAETLPDYEQCRAIQEEIWGAGFRELVPPTILMVSQKLGGVCAGAFDASGRMLGFVFGMTGLHDGELAHWSDMLAVRVEARGRHIGERLKHYQRELVRAVGVDTMFWTFDPLVARNAHLNLDRLGTRVVEYVPNMYGAETGSPLHGSLATDRFVVAWDLTRDNHVAAGPARPGVLVNPVRASGEPSIAEWPDASVVRVAIPRDADGETIARRSAWRAVTRDALTHYLALGYDIVRFHRGTTADLPCYELAARHQ